MTLLKILFGLVIIIGLLVFAWNFKAADEGDKKAKKYFGAGLALFIAGGVDMLSVVLFEVF